MRDRSFVLLGAAAGVALALAATESADRLYRSRCAARARNRHQKYQLLGLFVGALERVRAHYVEKPDDTKLIYSAINGMLSGLENSSFMDADAIETQRLRRCRLRTLWRHRH